MAGGAEGAVRLWRIPNRRRVANRRWRVTIGNGYRPSRRHGHGDAHRDGASRLRGAGWQRQGAFHGRL